MPKESKQQARANRTGGVESGSKRLPKKIAGLPRAVLFQHLERIPTGRVDREFLEQKVWWWRKERVILKRWVADIAEGWPDCELFPDMQKKNPKANLSSLSQADVEEAVIRSFGEQNPQSQENFVKWWSVEEVAAKAYEWEARGLGRYPLGEPYHCLVRQQREAWKSDSCISMNAVPHVWSDENDALNGGLLVLGNLTCWTQRLRFNLVAHDGYILKELKKHLASERLRLGRPNPKHPNENRRPLRKSWADIEGIDVSTHSNVVTTSTERQRRMITRRKRD